MADIADLVFDFFDLHSLYLLKWILSFICIILLQFALVFAYNDIILDDIDILGDACHEVSGFHESSTRGTFDFPIELYYVDKMHPRYEMPFHWHMEFELMLVLSGSFLC